MADDLEKDRQMLAELMEAGQKRGEIRDDFTPIQLALQFQRALFGTTVLWSLDPSKPLPDCLKEMVNVFWSGIRTQAASRGLSLPVDALHKEVTETPHMQMRSVKALTVAFLLANVLAGCDKQPQSRFTRPPAPVTVVSAVKQDVPVPRQRQEICSQRGGPYSRRCPVASPRSISLTART
jgi:hypothetical protein